MYGDYTTLKISNFKLFLKFNICMLYTENQSWLTYILNFAYLVNMTV